MLAGVEILRPGAIARAVPNVEHKYLPFSDDKQNSVATMEDLPYLFLVIRTLWGQRAAQRECLQAFDSLKQSIDPASGRLSRLGVEPVVRFLDVLLGGLGDLNGVTHVVP
jgi:hypothetical protein